MDISLMKKAMLPIQDVWDTSVLGSTAGALLTALLIIALSLFFRGIFARFIVRRLEKLAVKIKGDIDDTVFKTLEKPLSLVPVALALFIATAYLDPSGKLGVVLYSIIKTLIAVIIFWAAYNAIAPFSFVLHRLETVFSKSAVSWFEKAVRILVLLVAAATILEIWGIRVGPVIAGLGLFGVAVALGAQDMFKNLIAGMTIIAEKRFSPGDRIAIDGAFEGFVEEIGFRSTRIRRLDKAPVYIPNAQLADNAVINYTATTHRRIYWKIGVLYSTTAQQLQNIRDRIEAYILGTPAFLQPPEGDVQVRIDAFSDSSIDILIYCFTKTSQWEAWLIAKEKLALSVKDIVESEGTAFAFPSRSVYLETWPGAEPFVLTAKTAAA